MTQSTDLTAREKRRRVAVVGGGISGLAAAAAIRAADPTADVTVLEGDSQLGGKLRLGEVAGVTVDVGAEAMLNRRPEAVRLTRDSGLGDRLVHPAVVSANVWSRGVMRTMPKSLMGIPVDAKDLADSGLISRPGLARAAMDSMLPATRIGDEDVSVGWLIEERFGKEVVDRLLEPLLGGVYAGHARELSLRATMPQVVGLLERDKSLLKAAASSMPPADAPVVPVFAGIRGGMGLLPDAIATAAGVEVRLNTTVRQLARSAEGGWNLVVGSADDPTVLTADAVVLSTPGPSTAKLLRDVVPDVALELGRVEYASMAVITLAFSARDFPDVAGSGFLVPPVDARVVKAATYSFAKWDWVREDGGDLCIMRTSIGRHREERSLQVDDETLVEQSVADLADAIGLSVRPVDSVVARWGGALPQYAVGHVERMRRVKEAVARVPGLAVCGATYDGVGIPACIASGEAAAAKILEPTPKG